MVFYHKGVILAQNAFYSIQNHKNLQIKLLKLLRHDFKVYLVFQKLSWDFPWELSLNLLDNTCEAQLMWYGPAILL